MRAGERGPRDLAEARPPSHTKVSSGRGLAATPYVRRKGTARALPPSPAGRGLGCGRGSGGRATLLKPARRVTQRSPAGEDWRQPPTFDGRARRGLFPPLPLGEGWGAGGGRRGPRDLAEAPPAESHKGLQRARIGGNPLRSTEGRGAGSSPLSRWERVGVRAGERGPRDLAEAPPAESHKGLQRARIGGNPPTFDGRARRAPTARSTTPRSAWQSPRAGCADSRGRSSRRRRCPRSSAL